MAFKGLYDLGLRARPSRFLWPLLVFSFDFSFQQLPAAVRADFLDTQSDDRQLCQDGVTLKVISVILGCSTQTHSDLEIRSSCSEDVDFPKGTFFGQTLGGWNFK